MQTYKVLVDLYSTDATLAVEIATDADLDNCDEDMFLSAIQNEVEKHFNADDIAHFEVV
jgi:hypothetical protein